MKKILLSLLATLLVAAAALSLAACGAQSGGEETKPTTSVSRYESVGEYAHIEQALSWEKVNEFPIKSPDMTIDEMRALCVDFFRYTKTALWISDAELAFVRNSGGTQDEMISGVTYGGLPYVGEGSGSIYRLMDYMDPETHVVDLRNAVEEDKPYDGWKTFGSQCSIGAYWGWGRVINSAGYRWTQDCVASRKMVRVGPYVYDDRLRWLSKEYGTPHILKENGQQTMYESYAALHLGDGLVYYTSAGHVIMVSSEPHVEYAEDGTIDPAKSYITTIDQAQTWKEGKTENGQTYTYKSGVDTKRTFFDLYNQNYMPFTFLEFLGNDPVEETVVAFSHTGDTITVSELFSSQVTANYGISDIYAIVYDAQGNEVYKHAVRAKQASSMKIDFIRSAANKKVNNVETWGDLALNPDQDYKVEIVVQLSTGERPTLYTGKLIQE